MLCGVMLVGGCGAAPAKRGSAASEPVPPDPGALTVYGRYYPSLESLAPAGVEIGDLAMQDDRLVIHVHAETQHAGKSFERALERSGWFKRAQRESVDPAGLREGEYVLSVQPAR